MPRSPRLRKPLRIERNFLEAVAKRCPDHPAVLRPLGDLYTRAGQIAEGLAVDLRLIRLVPADPTAWYNLGCSFALHGEADQALDSLSHAVDLGYRDAGWMLRDRDLQSLQADHRLHALAKRIRAGV
jgi:tetratricopeptide (TPR) repeat protein